MMDQFSEFFKRLFGTESWPPRWHCGEWSEFHGWLYILSDIAIWGAYLTIPFFLFYFVQRKKNVPLPAVYWWFISFITLCGMTHLIDAIIFYVPVYRLSALVLFLTAVVSWGTIIALTRFLPEALKLRTSSEFEEELKIRRKTEERLKESEKLATKRLRQVERKNEEMEQFSYIVSHDLQEPVRTISSVLNLVKFQLTERGDTETCEHIIHSLQATERMQTMIRELLDYSRLGQHDQLTVIDVNKLLKDVTADLSNRINETGAIVNAGELPTLKGYRTSMRMLLQNLISNALKFSREGKTPRIEVGAAEDNNFWRFWVKDNGIGIREKDHGKVFEVFRRLHHYDKYEGSGIGLAHCKKIAQMHHGRIWLDSKPGKGSTFYFTVAKSLGD